ncbi:MAG: hypothetical protein OHK0017_05580 [Patescibacteria group bacterium]
MSQENIQPNGASAHELRIQALDRVIKEVGPIIKRLKIEYSGSQSKIYWEDWKTAHEALSKILDTFNQYNLNPHSIQYSLQLKKQSKETNESVNQVDQLEELGGDNYGIENENSAEVKQQINEKKITDQCCQLYKLALDAYSFAAANPESVLVAFNTLIRMKFFYGGEVEFITQHYPKIQFKYQPNIIALLNKFVDNALPIQYRNS